MLSEYTLKITHICLSLSITLSLCTLSLHTHILSLVADTKTHPVFISHTLSLVSHTHPEPHTPPPSCLYSSDSSKWALTARPCTSTEREREKEREIQTCIQT